MSIGIFGGTFNPIHYGHLRAAEEVRETLGLSKIIFVPSYLPPHKELDGQVDAALRLEAVRLAVADNPAFEVCAFEVEHGGSSYSIRTIEHIRQEEQGAPYFILGQDAFNEIMTWFEAPRHFSLAHFVVMSRPGAPRADLNGILGGCATDFSPTPRGFINTHGLEIIYLDVTALDIASTHIRKLCRENRSLAYLVPPVVERFIRTERMYQ